jgi:hypothetical protein
MRLQITSPSPVPPWMRVVDASAWVNGLNSRVPASARSDAACRAPRRRSFVLRARLARLDHLHVDLPRSVNLIALRHQVGEHLAQPHRIAAHRRAARSGRSSW